MKMKAFIVGVGLLSRVVIDVDGIEDEEEKKKIIVRALDTAQESFLYKIKEEPYEHFAGLEEDIEVPYGTLEGENS
jgi:hypothetical protein